MKHNNVRLSWLHGQHPLWIPLMLWSGAAIVSVRAETWIVPRYFVKGPPVLLVNTSAPSDLVCALHARKSKSMMFAYGNKTCAIYEGLGENSLGTAIFVERISPDLLEEVAGGKNTFASPTYADHTKEMAVDRDLSTYYRSYSGEPNPFWMVDLGEVRTVYEVRILPSDGSFRKVEVRLGMNLLTTGNFSSYVWLGTYKGPYAWSMVYLYCYSRGVRGRYLSVQKVLPDTYPLLIQEVEVYVKKKP